MPQKPSQASQAYSDSHAYIPPHVQEAMTKQMEHMSPSHMKQYAGAFVQQNMTQGRSAPQAGKVTGAPANYRPVTHLPRKDHFHQYKVQQPSRADDFAPINQAPDAQVQPITAPQQPLAPPQPTVYPAQQYQQPTSQTYIQQGQASGPQPNMMPDYDFFMNNQQPVQKRQILPGSNSSLPARLGLATVGLIVLLIVFNVVKGLLAGPSNYPYYLSVIQDQQAIVHISTTALEEEDLNTVNKNFAATAQTSVKSSQTDIVGVVVGSGKKIDPKKANLKVSTATDTELTTAAASGTYNSKFNEIMQDQLKVYKKDLGVIYDKTTNSKNRNLIKSQFNQAELLTQQLSANPAD